jgi:TrmH family RNA methyltransferase
VAATVRIPPSDVQSIADAVRSGHSLGLMVIDGVQDPQNLGALIRVAAASGYGGVICDHRSADPFGPKAARSAVGLLLEVPILRVDSLVATIAALQSADGLHWPVIVADTDGTPYRRARLAQPHFLVLGSEGRGPSPEVTAMADTVVTIPTERSVESLNVGIAAGVLAFEARAQRQESP